MIDSYGDGWNGNILTIRQGNYTFNFGSSFTRGKASGPIKIKLNSEI